MPISLISETPSFSLKLELGGDVAKALAAAIERSERLHGADGYSGKLASAIAEAVLKTLPWEYQPPSGPQLSFAASISRRLGVEIPREATQFRGAMHEFLAEYAGRLDVDGSPKKEEEIVSPETQRARNAVRRARERLKNRSR